MLFGFHFLTGNVFLTRPLSPDYGTLASAPSFPSAHMLEWHARMSVELKTEWRALGDPAGVEFLQKIGGRGKKPWW